MRVYVLLFNPRTDNEGIHALQVGDRCKVLMFADKDDATRFALLLEAQDFSASAAVEEFDSEEIEEFCRLADYDAHFVEPGELVVPPEQTLDEHTWTSEGRAQFESDAATEELDAIRRRLENLL